MRHDAWRQDPGRYPQRFEIAPRFADVDTLRHLNNSALHGLHLEARMRFLAATLGDAFWRGRGPRLPARRVATDFLLEGQYPEPLQAAVRLGPLPADAGPLTLDSALFQGGRCIGVQATQLQPTEKGLAVALPPAWREALAPHAASDAAPETQAAPEPAPPPRLAQFGHRRDLDTRYADLDPTGRVSEAAFMRGAEHSRMLMREAFATLKATPEQRAALGWLVARVDLHLLHPAPMPARWQLGAGVAHLGRSSVVLRTGFFDEQDRCAAWADSVLVFIDRQAGGPQPTPEPARELLHARRLLD